MKKFNNQTGCYKIDIFIDGSYSCSTDWCKTCKQAVKRFKELNLAVKGKVTAHFYKD